MRGGGPRVRHAIAMPCNYPLCIYFASSRPHPRMEAQLRCRCGPVCLEGCAGPVCLVGLAVRIRSRSDQDNLQGPLYDSPSYFFCVSRCISLPACSALCVLRDWLCGLHFWGGGCLRPVCVYVRALRVLWPRLLPPIPDNQLSNTLPTITAPSSMGGVRSKRSK